MNVPGEVGLVFLAAVFAFGVGWWFFTRESRLEAKRAKKENAKERIDHDAAGDTKIATDLVAEVERLEELERNLRDIATVSSVERPSASNVPELDLGGVKRTLVPDLWGALDALRSELVRLRAEPTVDGKVRDAGTKAQRLANDLDRELRRLRSAVKSKKRAADKSQLDADQARGD